MHMVYSDLFIIEDRATKVEILPSDLIVQCHGVLNSKDTIICVFRPIDDPFAAKRLQNEFLDELKINIKVDRRSIERTLEETIKAFHFSLLNPPSEYVPESGAAVLAVYVDPQRGVIAANCGSIALKHRINRKFKYITSPTDYFIGHPKHPFEPTLPGFIQVVCL